MVSVASLLNHDIEEEQLPTPTASSRYSSECSPAPSERVSKKPKLAKDAAIFHKGRTSGQIRYPPHETSNSRILDELGRLKVIPSPLAKIREFPRHIPYNSDKKQLFRKTGRDAFEVFQYEFRLPGHEREYPVLWDYNIGLVRMTPFFKCCRYPKTVPSKMLNQNPGLREICHSITGGALVAQGYWVPYEAAKALAATFCWDFRYALVPIFGPDFPDLCVKPGAQDYSIMVIDQRIIQQCTRDLEALRSMQLKSIVETEAVSISSKKDILSDKSNNNDQQNHSIFQPINRPTSVPVETPKDKSYGLFNTQMRTPDKSCLSSPATDSLSMADPSIGMKRPRIPYEGFTNQDHKTTTASSPSNSIGSSDSEVSPKTMPRKRGFGGSTRPQRAFPTTSKSTKGTSNDESVSQADLRAAQILVDLRAVVRNARKDM